MKSSSKTNPNPVPAPEPKPDLVLTPEEVAALEAGKAALTKSLGFDPAIYTNPPPPKAKKSKGVITPTVPPAVPKSMPAPEPPPAYEKVIPGVPSSLEKAKAAVEAEAEAKKLALAADHEQKVLSLKKAHKSFAESQALDSAAIGALAGVIQSKIDSATVIAKADRLAAERAAVLTPLKESRRIAVALLTEMKSFDLAPYSSVLSWDVPALERQHLITAELARRLGAALNTLTNVGAVITQLKRIIDEIDALDGSGLTGHSLLTEARRLAQETVWSTGWSYQTMKSIQDLQWCLAAMAKSHMKVDPNATVILPPAGHAGLTALTQEKSIVVNKAETDFNVFASGTKV